MGWIVSYRIGSCFICVFNVYLWLCMEMLWSYGDARLYHVSVPLYCFLVCNLTYFFFIILRLGKLVKSDLSTLKYFELDRRLHGLFWLNVINTPGADLVIKIEVNLLISISFSNLSIGTCTAKVHISKSFSIKASWLNTLQVVSKQHLMSMLSSRIFEDKLVTSPNEIIQTGNLFYVICFSFGELLSSCLHHFLFTSTYLTHNRYKVALIRIFFSTA